MAKTIAKTTRASQRKRGPKMFFYKTYNFLDKDPVIDEMRTALKDSGKTYQEIQADSGVSVTTLHNWFNGDTRKPQFATVRAAARAMGYDFKRVKLGARG